MCYGIWGLDNGETKPYQHPAENNYTVKKESHILEPGSILIWHPRDDKRFMHSLEFPPEMLKYKTKTFCRLSYVWIRAHDHGTYYTSGQNDGHAVTNETIVQDLNNIKNAETSPSWDANQTVENIRDGNLTVDSALGPSVLLSSVLEQHLSHTMMKKVKKRRKQKKQMLMRMKIEKLRLKHLNQKMW
jgi:hypothetical protein